jgi:hypothetical protein
MFRYLFPGQLNVQITVPRPAFCFDTCSQASLMFRYLFPGQPLGYFCSFRLFLLPPVDRGIGTALQNTQYEMLLEVLFQTVTQTRFFFIYEIKHK